MKKDSNEIKPDLWWDKDGESLEGWSWALDESLDDVQRVTCARYLGEKFVARVTLTVDEDGDPDETEAQLFDTQAEAEQAVRDSLEVARAAQRRPA